MSTNRASLSKTEATPMGFRNTREIGLDRMRLTLHWIYQWGYSSPSVIDCLTTDQKNGICARMVKAGLVEKISIKSSFCYPDMPRALVVLTKLGVQQAEQIAGCRGGYRPSGARSNLATIRHDLVVQRLVISEDYKVFTPARKLGDGRKGVKVPDAVLTNDPDPTVFLEVELTGKWGRELDQFVWQYFKIKHHRKKDFELVICSDQMSILERYKKAFEAHEITLWEIIGGRWKPKGKMRISGDLDVYYLLFKANDFTELDE